MKFGSRMDVFLPARAELLVRVGETSWRRDGDRAAAPAASARRVINPLGAAARAIGRSASGAASTCCRR